MKLAVFGLFALVCQIKQALPRKLQNLFIYFSCFHGNVLFVFREPFYLFILFYFFFFTYFYETKIR